MGNFLSWLQAFASSIMNPLLCLLLTSAQSPHALLQEALPSDGRKVGQISPGKNMIFHYTTAAFTLPPKPKDSSCCADLPRGWALYAISVRRLIVLYSGFLQTPLMRSPLPLTSIYVHVSQH